MPLLNELASISKLEPGVGTYWLNFRESINVKQVHGYLSAVQDWDLSRLVGFCELN